MKLFNENLSESDIKAHKQWARDNYEPHSPIKGIWHPVVQEECAKMNKEAHLNFMEKKIDESLETMDKIEGHLKRLDTPKEPEIIGDDYPTYEESVNQTLAEQEEEDSEMEEHQHGTYEHMLDTFDWWQDYLAQVGPDGVLNIAMEVIKYADKLKDAKIEIKPKNSCCGDSNCDG